jgi:Na+/proline symporter
MRSFLYLPLLYSTGVVDHNTVLFLVTFLLAIMVIGMCTGKNTSTFKSYVLADKNCKTPLLVFTFLATHIGAGNVLDAPGAIYKDGLIVFLPFLGLALAFLFRAFVIAPHMGKFGDCLTMGDVMGKLYGKLAQIITGALGLWYAVCISILQLLGVGTIMTSLLGFPAIPSIILIGLLLTAHSAFGGIKAIILTDLFQFVIFVLAIQYLLEGSLCKVGGIEKLYSLLPPEKWQVIDHPRVSYYLVVFLLWSVFSTGITSPPTFQRLLMASTSKELTWQYVLVSIFDPIFQLAILLIGLAGVLLAPTDLPPSQLVPYLVSDLFSGGSTGGLNGCISIGLLAVVMSTADSYFHAAGVSLTQDIFAPVWKREFNKILYAKYMTFLVGVVSILLSCFCTGSLALVFTAMQATGPILIFPLIAGIMGFKADKRTFMITTGVTVLTFVIARWQLTNKHLAVLWSILANGFCFFSVHYFLTIIDKRRSTS